MPILTCLLDATHQDLNENSIPLLVAVHQVSKLLPLGKYSGLVAIWWRGFVLPRSPLLLDSFKGDYMFILVFLCIATGNSSSPFTFICATKHRLNRQKGHQLRRALSMMQSPFPAAAADDGRMVGGGLCPGLMDWSNYKESNGNSLTDATVVRISSNAALEEAGTAVTTNRPVVLARALVATDMARHCNCTRIGNRDEYYVIYTAEKLDPLINFWILRFLMAPEMNCEHGR